jgi:transcriptional regulator with XRE-family HTH domain
MFLLLFGGMLMKSTSDMIRQLCEQMKISQAELARRLGQSPQNFGKKLKRETITLEELKTIAEVMDIIFEQAFILPGGKKIKTGN